MFQDFTRNFFTMLSILASAIGSLSLLPKRTWLWLMLSIRAKSIAVREPTDLWRVFCTLLSKLARLSL